MPTKKEHYWSHRNFVVDLLKQLPLYIFWKNTECVYLGCNDAFAKSVGLSCANDIVGKTDYDLPWTKQESDAYRENDKRVMATRTPITNIEEPQTTLEGQRIILLTNKVPLLNDENEVMGVLGIYSDITDRKYAEAAMEKAKRAAEAANIAKSEFIASMSHDLRTPLSGIIGMTTILDEYVTEVWTKSCIKEINDSASQLLNLLNQILELTTHPKGDVYLKQYQSFSLRSLLDDLTALEIPMIHVKKLDFNLSIATDVPDCIRSDRLRLERILLNLLGNAIKFTHQGGIFLTIAVVSKRDKHVTLKFILKDTGIGIPSALQATVFERFVKNTPSYEGNYDGHGLGLYIVKQYVRALNGEITLKSKTNKGTTITIILPVEYEDTKIRKRRKQNKPLFSPAPAVPNQDSSPAKPCILLVEDNTIALHIAELVLKKAGYNYVTAMDAQSAFEAVQQHNFDMIISDIGLPDISGIELTAKIRSWEKEKGKMPMPIVGLSAHATEDAVEDSQKAGMNCLVAKPLTRTLLTQLIHDLTASQALLAQGSKFNKKTPEKIFSFEPFPLLDLEASINMLGSRQLLKEMLTILINEELPEGKKELARFFVLQDWKKLHAVVHKIKSGAVYCGATRLEHVCQILENYLKSTEAMHDKTLYQHLLLVIEQTEKETIRWLENNQ